MFVPCHVIHGPISHYISLHGLSIINSKVFVLSTKVRYQIKILTLRVCMFVGACAHAEATSVFCNSFYSFEQGLLSLGSCFLGYQKPAASSDPLSLPFPEAGVTSMYEMTSLLRGCRNVNSSPQNGTANNHLGHL